MIFKQKLVKFIEWAHLKLFKHEMGPEMREFLVNLIWSFLSGSVSAIVVLAVNIIAGRLMGPEEYGKYNLILVISSYLLVPIYLGLDLASVRAIARSKDQKEVGKNVTSSITFVVFSTIIVISLISIFQKPVAALFSTNTQLLKYALFFTSFLVVKTILDCCVRGIKLFKQQFKGRLLETVLVLVAFVMIFLVAQKQNYASYVYVLSVGAVALSLYYIMSLKKYLGSFSFLKIKEQLSYGKFFALTATLTTVFVSLDKLLINKYLTAYDLGLYVAYYTVSVALVLQIATMFTNVFFPSIAKDMNKAVFSKIERLMYLGFVPLLAVIIVLVFLLMKLFGKKYGIQLDLILIFGLLGTIQIVTSVYYSVILTFEKTLYKKYLLFSNLVNLFTVVIYFGMFFTHSISIKNIALALIVNYIIVFLVQKRLIKRRFCDKVYACN